MIELTVASEGRTYKVAVNPALIMMIEPYFLVRGEDEEIGCRIYLNGAAATAGLVNVKETYSQVLFAIDHEAADK